MGTAEVLLETRSLNRRFGGLLAVADVSFQTRRGQIKAVIGPNGAGKTTLFNLISGNLSSDSGTVLYLGEDITRFKPHMIARRGILRTFQTTRLFGHMTVLENVMVGRHVRSRAGFLSCMVNGPWIWREEKEIRRRALETLEIFDLEGESGELAQNLPFGRQRMVEFARAMATEPELLLLDEPAAGLNVHETAELSDMLLRIRDRGITLLVVEHDMSLVMDVSDEILVLDRGAVITEGTPEVIQKDERVIRIYLGEEYADQE